MVLRPAIANLPTRGARTGAVDASTVKLIAGDEDDAWSMALVVIERPCWSGADLVLIGQEKLDFPINIALVISLGNTYWTIWRYPTGTTVLRLHL
jgi:hypothetical protein